MGRTLKCISPVDGSVFAERAVLDEAAARQATAGARAAQRAWAARPMAERIELVMQGVANVGAMNDEIVPELAHQMGRPVRYGGEFGGFSERASHMARIAGDALADIVVEDSGDFRRFIAREPQGVVLVIAPWNYPYMTAINSIAPARIAGNTVVLKHASQTPLVGERMARAFHQAGIPAEVFRNVFLDHGTTSALIAARAFDFVNFTDSVGGGRAMFNSGQCCCGIERIYVHESLFDAFVDRAVAIVDDYRLGDPLDPETTLGPMAQGRFADLVRAQTAEAVAAGARALIDPAQFPRDGGAYLMPQILIDVNHSMRVMREESFGPVVGIMPVKDDAEAVALMNDSEFGLTASIWTADTARAQAIGARIETGTVFMNRADYLDPALCWTGCRDTGRGGGLSVIGYHNLTRPKSYHLRKLT